MANKTHICMQARRLASFECFTDIFQITRMRAMSETMSTTTIVVCMLTEMTGMHAAAVTILVIAAIDPPRTTCQSTLLMTTGARLT